MVFLLLRPFEVAGRLEQSLSDGQILKGGGFYAKIFTGLRGVCLVFPIGLERLARREGTPALVFSGGRRAFGGEHGIALPDTAGGIVGSFPDIGIFRSGVICVAAGLLPVFCITGGCVLHGAGAEALGLYRWGLCAVPPSRRSVAGGIAGVPFPAAGFPPEANALFTALNVALVVFEDRMVFPTVLAGYCEYRRVTPFLIPNGRSIRACFRGEK